MNKIVRVRNLHKGESSTLPVDLLEHGMPYLVEDWAWVVEVDGYPGPFALIVASFAHGWALLWRVLSIYPLPAAVPLTWFLEALPQVFAAASARGCVGFVTLLADDRPEEVKMARIVTRLAQGGIMPFQGSIAAGMLAPIVATTQKEA